MQLACSLSTRTYPPYRIDGRLDSDSVEKMLNLVVSLTAVPDDQPNQMERVQGGSTMVLADPGNLG